MPSMHIFEQYLNGRFAVVPAATEADYYALWHARGIDRMAPAAMAVAGALLADRLPWVFTAGYQATLRNAFRQLPPGGWAAFAATEDVDDPRAHPGITLQQDGAALVLRGHKSWLAHSRHVDHLIVTINDPGGDKRQARGVIVERERDGVSITHREAPGFLAAMSQGFLEFRDTRVVAGSVFEFEAIRQFGRTEAKFVMLAATAFMLARCGEFRDLQDRLFALGGALLTLLGEIDTSRQVYAAVDREFQRCTDQFEMTDRALGIPGYLQDQRLFRMYSEKIQRRAGYARAESR